MQNQPRYKRVLLKLSGEALAQGADGILNFDFIMSVADALKKCIAEGVQIGVIVGAGNIWRGRQGGKMDRVRADSMGMLATTINALALQDTFIQAGLDAKVMTAVEMRAFAKPFVRDDAIEALSNNKVVIFESFCSKYFPIRLKDDYKSEHYFDFYASAFVGKENNIDGILYREDKIESPGSICHIFLHELAHIFLVRNELDEKNFYDTFCEDYYEVG